MKKIISIIIAREQRKQFLPKENLHRINIQLM